MKRRYQRVGSGDLTNIAGTRPLTFEEVVGRHVQVQPDGCWLYNGQDDKYGLTSGFVGQPVLIHRFVYETLVGPIEPGHVLHHRCLNKGCCNPAHLEQLTPSEHTRLHAKSRKK
jgi:hypothetical protein